MIYRHLNTARKEVRLLKIHPISDQATTTIIECQLCTAFLTDVETPRHETVSYCWGDASNTKDIKVNGEVVLISANAEHAIRMLALSDAKRTIWIDALCIDQASPEERTQQVSIMAEIYKLGARNNIFLGQRNNSTIARAFRNVTDVRNELARLPGAVGTDGSLDIFQGGGSAAGRISWAVLPSSLPFDVEALCRLYSCPWFGRLWVLQEATLTSSNYCLCGSDCFDLHPMLEVAAFLHYCYAEHTPAPLATLSGLQNAAAMWLCIRFKKGGDLLCHLLRRGRATQCSDPRDRVFAVRGMSRLVQGGRHDEAIEKLITPEYDRPVSDVYRDATRAAILESGDIFTLSLISHRQEADIYHRGQPSWMLKLDQKFDGNYDPMRLHMDQQSRQMASEFYEANTPASASHDPEVLRLPGFLIGAVAQCSEVLKRNNLTRSYDQEVVHELLTSSLRVAGIGTNDRSADQRLSRSLARTLTANRDGKDQVYADDRQLDHFAELLRICSLDDNRVHESPIRSGLRDLDEHTAAMWKAIERFCKWRRICRTTDGNLALVPHLARRMDVIVMAQPRGYCCVLRPAEESGERVLHLVGVCYVDSVRNDELAAAYEDRETNNLRWFDIR